MGSVVWVAFCGECDHQLSDSEARREVCPMCEDNEALEQ